MKKLLVLMLILTIPSFASAGLINVVTDGVGSMGHAGTIDDPLWPGEFIGIKITLTDSHGSDGYDLDLHVTGPGTLKEEGDYGILHQIFPPDPDWFYTGIQNNAIAHMSDIHLMGQFTGDLVWGLEIHCDGEGEVTVDLTLAGDMRVDGQPITEADLGDLTIYQVPEPMTAVLLALGGLVILRRHRYNRGL